MDEWFEQMMEQMTKRIVALIGNQNRVNQIQYDYNRYRCSKREVSDEDEEQEYDENVRV